MRDPCWLPDFGDYCASALRLMAAIVAGCRRWPPACGSRSDSRRPTPYGRGSPRSPSQEPHDSVRRVCAPSLCEREAPTTQPLLTSQANSPGREVGGDHLATCLHVRSGVSLRPVNNPPTVGPSPSSHQHACTAGSTPPSESRRISARRGARDRRGRRRSRRTRVGSRHQPARFPARLPPWPTLG